MNITTHTLYKILGSLPNNSCQLSSKSGITYSSIIKTIKICFKLGLLKSVKVPDNKRVKAMYSITDDGKNVYQILSRLYK